MKPIYLLIIALSVLFLGCSAPESLRSIPVLGSKTKAVRSDDLLITLERTQCYGTCPAYQLTIEADGTVTFNGEKYTNVVGKAKGKIDSQTIDKLIEQFNSIGYLDLNETYDGKTCPSYATDMSTVNTSIRQNGKTKAVSHYLGCSENAPDHKPYPPGLGDMERSIDAAARSNLWIKGN